MRQVHAFRLYNGKKRTNRFLVRMGLFSTARGREMTEDEIYDFCLKHKVGVKFHDIIKDSKIGSKSERYEK